MQSNAATIDVLSDLVRINLDRIAAYKEAQKRIDGDYLSRVFDDFILESSHFTTELKQKIATIRGNASGNNFAGKLYQKWLNLKAGFKGRDKETILSSCEYGEDSAQKVYSEVLDNLDLNPDILLMVREQKNSLQKAHKIIKSQKDNVNITVG